MNPVFSRTSRLSSTCLSQLLSSVGKNRIWKFLAYSLAVCTGCILVSTLLFLQSVTRNGPLLAAADSQNEFSAQHSNQRHETYPSDVSEAFLLRRQGRRKQHVTDVCRKLNATNQLLTANKTLVPSQFRHIFVNDDLRLLYCEVPKVACTNWKRIMLVLTGKMTSRTPEQLKSNDVHGILEKTYLRRLDSFTMDEILYRLDSYYKFMFVREPFERLLSAYHNKFTSKYNEMFKRVFGRKIVKNYRTKPTNESLEGGHDVTFEEFVSYVLDPKTTKRLPFNAHWRQYHELCHPCLIHYDLIGKYETMQEDAQLTLSQIALRGGDLLAFPTVGPRRNRTSDLVRQKFANISTADIHRLWKLYSADFSLFGYPYPSVGVVS